MNIFFSDIYDIRGWKGFFGYNSSSKIPVKKLFPKITDLPGPGMPVEREIELYKKFENNVPITNSSALCQTITAHELFIARKYKESAERYRIAYKLASHKDRLLVSLAESLLFTGNIGEAKKAFKKYSEKNPHDPELNLRKIQIGF